jgi:hypothetical protein
MLAMVWLVPRGAIESTSALGEPHIKAVDSLMMMTQSIPLLNAQIEPVGHLHDGVGASRQDQRRCYLLPGGDEAATGQQGEPGVYNHKRRGAGRYRAA